MFQDLSNDSLIEQFDKWVCVERRVSHRVLQYMVEILTREIFLEQGYPTMFEYLTKKFRFPNGVASRRIASAKLLIEVPAASQKIKEGKLNLVQTSYLVQAVNAANKNLVEPVSTEQKGEILSKIENQSFEKSQQIICGELGIPPIVYDKKSTQSDGSVILTITMTAEQYKNFQQAGELASHAVSSRGSAALIDYLATKEIARRTEIKRASPKLKSPSQNPRAIAPNVRKYLMNASAQKDSSTASFSAFKKVSGSTAGMKDYEDVPNPGCDYTDSKTGKRCGSHHFLQVDHSQPVWAGGSNKIQNLQLLCSQHNRWKYQREAGITKISVPIRNSSRAEIKGGRH